MHDILQHHITNHQPQIATNENTTFSPNFCYRLDKNTSGIIIAALSYPALQLLNELIRQRKTHKQYHCIVIGKPPTKGTIDEPLFKGFDKKSGKAKTFVNHHKGLEAHTQFQTVQTITHSKLSIQISLLKVVITTGRMHQIRVHLAHLGYPILGDLSYGNPTLNRLLHKHEKINRQLLHASHYHFYDTIQKKEISIDCDLSDDFSKLFPKKL